MDAARGAVTLEEQYPWGKGGEIRIFLAFAGDYRAYRDALAVGIPIVRPCSEVDTTDLQALEEEVARFEPQVLICSRPKPAAPGVWPAWVELSVDPTRPTKVSVGGRHFGWTNPTLEELLDVIDEVEQLP